MAQLPKITTRGSLVEKSYQVIKNAIISMDVKPGQPLPEEKLVEQLGISRTPLRAALTKLAHEELVDIYPGRGTYVSELSYQDMVDTLQVREVLERLAAGLAVINSNPNDQEHLDRMDELLQQQQEWAEKKGGKDMGPFLKFDNEFHSVICELSKNSVLKRQILSLKDKFNRFVILSQSLESRASGVIEEHKTVLEAIRMGNQKRAEEAMGNHILRVRLGIEEGIQKHLS